MKLIAVAAAALLGAAAAGQSYDWSEATGEFTQGFEESKAICRALKAKEPPRADRPDAKAVAALRGCDSEALYYGIGMKADPVKARQCAFLERDAGDDGVFGGSIMLMTIYANGVGARRDLDVATHLACGIEGAPFESDGRVRHLAGAKMEGWTGSDFHFCDDVTSGLAMGYCAGHHERIDTARRAAALAVLMRGWTPAERQAFAPLQKARDAWVDAHGGGEVDLSGTARAAMQIGAEEAAREAFTEMLRRLSTGRAPRYTSAQYRAADAALNAAYRKAIREADTGRGIGAVTQVGIRDAQRAWLRYRDAFVAFAKLKWPGVPSDSLAAWLTIERTKMLQGEE
ncbi:DUF1311 domain-containing protein [Sphingomonas parva]|uniref:DUF1311 domain-containing protein n=1 Tax=Sphingomonas parva TaxID=2555898 RepID=A0A4Y8ZMI8_9SPHN|nr:lysozyme inhibitor LprI family protein [Sphingomonas parva]TFI57233.1 DUF1311 domain-containing protein [Sphingomonas parva]